MKKAALLSLALLGAACSGGSSDGISDPTPLDPGTARLNFAVTFPKADGSAKTLIDPATDRIEVEVLNVQGASTVARLHLTRATPTGSATVPVGRYTVAATAWDDADPVNPVALETTGTDARLIAGDNAVAIRFLGGEWTFATPVVTDAGVTISGFYLDEAGNSAGVPPVTAAAVDPSLPTFETLYDFTWIVDRPGVGPDYLVTQARVGSQFAGGVANRGYFDGAGFNLTTNCGEIYDGPQPAGCQSNNGPGLPGERNIRIIGDLKMGGGQGAEALLPAATFSSTDPAFATQNQAQVVNGTTINGSIFEYSVSATTPPTSALFTGLGPASVAKAALSNVLTITDYQPVILCRDGYNGRPVDGSVEMGDWVFREWDCSTGPCTQTGPSCASTTSGGQPYYTCGDFNSNAGECNWGLRPANVGNLGEWCENVGGAWNCRTDGFASPWEFQDFNMDGVVDLGSFYFEHYLSQSFAIDYTSFPFSATGTAVPLQMQVTIQ